MPRDWSDLFITGERRADAAASAHAAPAGERRGFLRRLRDSLAKTRQALGGELHATLFHTLDERTWERLEEALIAADVGASTTSAVVATLEAEAHAGEATEAGGRSPGGHSSGDSPGGDSPGADSSGARMPGPASGEALTERLIELLAEAAITGEGRIDVRARPTVILVVGVNGTGKTTTAGKLAWHLRQELGLTVVLAAADTFRAAATEQLHEWAARAGCEIVTGAEGSDPGAVAFEALARARSEQIDVVVVDTAGRLHTQEDLMGELAKVRRVIARQLDGAPHETLLTIDATTGQNGLRQARLFAQAARVSGIVLTKLDGTARGGIALAIARELALPVKLIGVGETLEDLRPFDAREFAQALIAQ